MAKQRIRPYGVASPKGVASSWSRPENSKLGRPFIARARKKGFGGPGFYCFNPRSRRGSDFNLGQGGIILQKVSIHAPAGGATNRIWHCFDSACFNPRSRGGSDALRGRYFCKGICFNPRSRGGSDRYQHELFLQLISFQSTLPRGERPWTCCPG